MNRSSGGAVADPSADGGGILFVLGAPRSGTSLLSRLLLDYFDFGMGPEGHWILPLAKRAPEEGALSDDATLGRLIRQILGTEMFEIVHGQYAERFGWPVQVTEEKVRQALSTRTYAGVAFAALQCLAHELRRSRVGTKDPGFVRDLDLLDELFPEAARYLVVLRDGRDVALSMAQQVWGQKTAYANAKLWVETYQRIEAFRARLPAHRFLTVRYESLLRDPEAECRALEQFLGTRLEPTRRVAFVQELAQGRRSQNYDKWKSRMSDRERRIYEAVAGDWLDRYEYERSVASPMVWPWEHAWYTTSEYARRAVRKLKLTLGIPEQEVPTSTAPEAAGS